MTDPVSDMLIRIKNAQKAGLESVRVSYSKFKHEIARTLERAGLLMHVERRGKKIKKTLEVDLVYRDEAPAISGIKLISTPSRRRWVSTKEMTRPRRGGLIIVSTPKGVMTSLEAYKQRVGGMLIAEVW